jgi:hypothetical protein
MDMGNKKRSLYRLTSNLTGLKWRVALKGLLCGAVIRVARGAVPARDTGRRRDGVQDIRTYLRTSLAVLPWLAVSRRGKSFHCLSCSA